MQTGDYGRLVSLIGMMYGLSAPRIRGGRFYRVTWHR